MLGKTNSGSSGGGSGSSTFATELKLEEIITSQEGKTEEEITAQAETALKNILGE